MNKDIHKINEAYEQMNQMDLPVLELEISSCRGERDVYANKIALENVKHMFYTPEGINYYKEFTPDMPTWERCLEILATGGAVTINSEESSYVLCIDREMLLGELDNDQTEMQDSLTDEEIDQEVAKVARLPDIKNEWKVWKERQKALKNSEHGLDLTF